jgi:hypothetical protein
MYWRPYLPDPVDRNRRGLHKSWAVGAIVSFALATFFAWAFYVRFWEHRDCIAAALSSCVTDDGDNLIFGGVFWALPAALFGLVGLGCLRAYLATRAKNDA